MNDVAYVERIIEDHTEVANFPDITACVESQLIPEKLCVEASKFKYITFLE
jgi:hypothetical protein